MNIMKSIYYVTVACASLTGLIAASYWYKSSIVPYPPKLHGIVPVGGSATVFVEPLTVALRESGRLNKIAACWSGLAAFFGGVSSVLAVLSS